MAEETNVVEEATEETDVINELLNSTEENSSKKLVQELLNQTENKSEMITNLIQEIVGVWARNDHLLAVLVKAGYANALKEYLMSPEVIKQLGNSANLVMNLIENTEFKDHEDVPFVMLDTIRGRIQLQEVSAVKSWENERKITQVLNEDGMGILPTTSELRMLMLINTLLDIRNSKKSPIITLT